MTFPVVLGAGKWLFGTGVVPRTLKLVSSSITSSGRDRQCLPQRGEPESTCMAALGEAACRIGALPRCPVPAVIFICVCGKIPLVNGGPMTNKSLALGGVHSGCQLTPYGRIPATSCQVRRGGRYPIPSRRARGDPVLWRLHSASSETPSPGLTGKTSSSSSTSVDTIHGGIESFEAVMPLFYSPRKCLSTMSWATMILQSAGGTRNSSCPRAWA